MTTLVELKPGETAKFIGFTHSNKTYRHKLLAMGLTPGTIILVKRIAPLGDPIEIQIRGFSLMLRKNEAQALKIERISTCIP